MADVLVVAETAEGKLKKTTHSAVTFARKAAEALGGKYAILVIGSGVAGAVTEAQALERVRHCRGWWSDTVVDAFLAALTQPQPPVRLTLERVMMPRHRATQRTV